MSEKADRLNRLERLGQEGAMEEANRQNEEEGWMVVSCSFGSDDLGETLDAGWEPFAVTSADYRALVWLRKRRSS